MVEAATLLAAAWFDRDYASAIRSGEWRRFPSFLDYVPRLVGRLPDDVVELLLDHHGEAASPGDN